MNWSLLLGKVLIAEGVAAAVTGQHCNRWNRKLPPVTPAMSTWTRGLTAGWKRAATYTAHADPDLQLATRKIDL